MAGIYIHIPFCESRCIYCDFYSTTSLKLRDDYVDALCHEMELRPLSSELGGRQRIETIYLGGGTPSQLTDEHLARLFEGLKRYLSNKQNVTEKEKASREDPFEGMEITMECNPDDVTDEFCATLQKLPINRISMGAQTFSNNRLHFLHRRHNADEVRTAVRRLRGIGIHNISIDLMFGFPDETLEDWTSDISEALELNVEHLSAYSLMYEEGTPLYRMLEHKKIQEIDEELSLQMYETLCGMLTSAEFDHYEISNFARPGYRSRHNSSYWNEVPYIGLGAAAHSYKRTTLENGEMKVIRSWNIASLPAYIDSVRQDILPSECEILDLNTRYNDLITTALRTSDGINLAEMSEEFGDGMVSHLLHEAKDKIKRGLMEVTDLEKTCSSCPPKSQHLRLTQKGIYISDDIMGDLVIVT